MVRKRLVADAFLISAALHLLQSKRLGVRMLYGAEVNILNQEGKLDLDDEILESLDYVIASMHRPIFKSGTADENTRAYIKAMENPNVNIIGHCDDEKFPVDYFALFRAAMENHVLLEINNSSLSPNGYRGDTTYADLLILNLSKHFNYPVLFSSDSHGTEHVGDFQYAEALARKADIPEDLILNYSVRKFMGFLGER